MKIISTTKTIEKLRIGVNKLAKTIAPTLGGKGKNVIINDDWTIKTINDGISIAREFELEDEIENTGAILATLAAEKTDEETGNATTTTIVLLNAYLNEIKNGSRELRDKINIEIEKVVEEIQKSKREITENDIYKIAKNASLDEEIAVEVEKIIKKVGKDGIVNIEESQREGIESELIDGIRINTGYISPYFINLKEKRKAELKNSSILITKKKLSIIRDMVGLMELLIKNGNSSLTIFCSEISDEVLGFLIENKLKGTFQSLVVKTKEFDDMEAITGAKVISDDNQFQYNLESLGLGNVIAGRKETIISSSQNRKKEIELKIEELKKLDDDKEIKERISKLENGIAVIKIGGKNAQETTEKRKKLEDAVNSAKSALKSGIIEGGGMALYRIAKQIEESEMDGEEINIILEVLKAPLKQLLENSEENFEEVIKGYDENKGYNVVSQQWENLYESGIIDSTDDVIISLKNAIATGNQILTISSGIFNKKDDSIK